MWPWAGEQDSSNPTVKEAAFNSRRRAQNDGRAPFCAPHFPWITSSLLKSSVNDICVYSRWFQNAIFLNSRPSWITDLSFSRELIFFLYPGATNQYILSCTIHIKLYSQFPYQVALLIYYKLNSALSSVFFLKDYTLLRKLCQDPVKSWLLS